MYIVDVFAISIPAVAVPSVFDVVVVVMAAVEVFVVMVNTNANIKLFILGFSSIFILIENYALEQLRLTHLNVLNDCWLLYINIFLTCFGYFKFLWFSVEKT